MATAPPTILYVASHTTASVASSVVLEREIERKPYITVLLIGPEQMVRERLLRQITSDLLLKGFSNLRLEGRPIELYDQRLVYPFVNEETGNYVGVYVCTRIVYPIRHSEVNNADLVFVANSPKISHCRVAAIYNKIVSARSSRYGFRDSSHFRDVLESLGSMKYMALPSRGRYQILNHRTPIDILAPFFRRCFLKIRLRQLAKEYRHRRPGGYLDEIAYSPRGIPIPCSPPGWRFEEGQERFETFASLLSFSSLKTKS